MASAFTTTIDGPAGPRTVRRMAWRGGLLGRDFTWAVAVVLPYIAVFLAGSSLFGVGSIGVRPAA